MAETYDDSDDGLTDFELTASRDLRVLLTGERILKAIAGIAAALALAAAVFSFWTYWDFGGQGGEGAQRFRQAAASALSSSWGWGLVALGAFLGSLLLRAHLARLWIESGDDEEV